MEYTSYEWIEMWHEDREAMAAVMTANMVSDIECGYNPHGGNISRQRAAIDSYEHETERTFGMLACMSPEQAAHWCRMDMMRRGVI